ncbi:MAG: EscU/YscU/HrcU family type III secretion system export apparatus switch protein [Gammaproteobacteria bacterium]|nr:EscU/YscU/HrcU family type III secretion system export apparatus switch protein [Gammaproteobacteria bacterium]
MSETISNKEIEEALALFYDGGEAPVISERQFGEHANALVALAQEAGIPVYENPELLHQLSTLNIGDNIPPELYRLVAEILAFAFYMQGKAPTGYESI